MHTMHTMMPLAGWLMYGSRKPDEKHAWTVSYLVDQNGVKSDCTEDVATLVEKMSIRNKYDANSLTNQGRVFQDEFDAKKLRQEMEKAQIADAYEDSYEIDNNDESWKMLETLCRLLGKERATSYFSWWKVGRALANIPIGESLARRELWMNFASQCKTKFDKAEHHAYWEQMGPPAHGPLGMGSLRWWAKKDNEVGYEAWQKTFGETANRKIVTGPGALLDEPPTPPQDGEARGIKIDELAEQLNTIFSKSSIKTDFAVGDTSITFEDEAGQVGVFYFPNGVVVYGSEKTQSYVIPRTFSTNPGSLSYLSNVPSSAAFDVELETDGVNITAATLKGKTPHDGISMKAFNLHTKRPVLKYRIQHSAERRTTAANDMKDFRDVIDAAHAEALKTQFGITSATFNVNNNITANNITALVVNTNGRYGEEDDVDLVEAFQSGATEFFNRIKFVPDMKKEGCIGDMFYCETETNRWVKYSNPEMANVLVQEAGKLDILTHEQIKYMKSNRGSKAIIQLVARRVIDKGFPDRMDENPDLFAVNNGVIDTSSGSAVFRQVRVDDYILKHARWDYTPDEDGDAASELETFLKQILPIDAERNVVLTFFASLMSGKRREKKFLVLTDRSAGNNGKSTLMLLFRDFFDKYASNGGTKYVIKATFSKGKDGHDAGTEIMRGCRLLIAEELKNDVELDVGNLKAVSGGAYRVEGRSIGTGNHFQFMWQAGLVLIFNEGDCPRFDPGDTPFMKRMLVAPMRSNFVTYPENEFEFPLDDSICDKFPRWYSALADVLMSHYLSTNRTQFFTEGLPASMTEWKTVITSDANPMGEWLDGIVEITGDKADIVWRADLKDLWDMSHVGSEAKLFSTKLLKGYFATKSGVVFSVSARKGKGAESKPMRDAFSGVKIVAVQPNITV